MFRYDRELWKSDLKVISLETEIQWSVSDGHLGSNVMLSYHQFPKLKLIGNRSNYVMETSTTDTYHEVYMTE